MASSLDTFTHLDETVLCNPQDIGILVNLRDTKNSFIFPITLEFPYKKLSTPLCGIGRTVNAGA